jgi:leucyl-tRNA synthetase
VEWTQSGAEGAFRFVQRVWAIFSRLQDAGGSGTTNMAATPLIKYSHRTAASIDKAIREFRFNAAIAACHDWVNTLKKAESASEESLETQQASARMLAICITPFMPHLAEECWAAIGEKGFVSQASWPVSDPALMAETTVTLPIQVNGKRRGEIEVEKEAAAGDIEKIALANPDIADFIAGKEIKKVIVVPGRIVNIVAA